VFPPNDQKLESISLVNNLSDTRLTLEIRSDGIEYRLTPGFGKWSKGRGSLFALVGASEKKDQLLATSAAWTTDDTLVVRVCACETPFYLTFNLRFEGDLLIRNWQQNVGFDNTKQTQMVGHVE